MIARSNRAALLLGARTMLFKGADFFFGPLGAFTFLFFDFRDTLLFRRLPRIDERIEFCHENAPGEHAVKGLRARCLAFDRDTAGNMPDLDTGRTFVDVLSSRASAVNKTLLKIVFADSQAIHIGAEQGLFIFTGDRVCHDYEYTLFFRAG